MSQRCTATTAAGAPCRAWAVRGSDPPRCAAHREQHVRDRGTHASEDEPTGVAGQQALISQQELVSQQELAAQIEALDARIERLGAYMDAHRDALDLGDLCRLLDLYSTMMGRVTRMRQAHHHLDAGVGSALMRAFHGALDLIAEERGIVL